MIWSLQTILRIFSLSVRYSSTFPSLQPYLCHVYWSSPLSQHLTLFYLPRFYNHCSRFYLIYLTASSTSNCWGWWTCSCSSARPFINTGIPSMLFIFRVPFSIIHNHIIIIFYTITWFRNFLYCLCDYCYISILISHSKCFLRIFIHSTMLFISYNWNFHLCYIIFIMLRLHWLSEWLSISPQPYN